MLHVGVAAVERIIEIEHLLVVAVLTRLVENAQNLVQSSVDLTVKTRYLYDDAVVRQAVNKGIRKPLRHKITIVVERIVTHVENWLLDVTNLMTQQIDGHHRNGMAVAATLDNVLRVLVVNAQVLAEPKRLRFEPGLLQFYQDEVLAAVSLAHRRTEIDAEHRQRVALVVSILMRTNLNPRDVLL